MSLTTLADILESARVKMVSIATSRDPTRFFLEHTTNLPFEQESPHAGADGFEVVSRQEVQASGFGLTGAREWKSFLVVKLGHAPFGTDEQRNDWLADDVERVVDILEAHTWPTGTMLVLHKETETNRQLPNWWVTELRFDLVWVGSLRTS